MCDEGVAAETASWGIGWLLPGSVSVGIFGFSDDGYVLVHAFNHVGVLITDKKLEMGYSCVCSKTNSYAEKHPSLKN